LYVLDASRGVASLAVVIWHWQHFFYDQTAPPADYKPESQPLYTVFRLFYDHGHWGVEYFFALSGFIFFWLYSDRISKHQLSWVQFFVQRLARLYPLHVACLVLVCILQIAYTRLQGNPFVYPFNDPYHFALNLFFASHWGLEKGWSFNAPSWSVSVEVLVYAAFFLLCVQGRRGLPSCLVLSGILFTVNHAVLHSDIARGATSFLIGGATYHLARIIIEKHLLAFRYIHIALVIAWTAVVVSIYNNNLPTIVQHAETRDFLVSLFATAFLFPLTILALAVMEVKQEISAKRFAAIGNMTYSSYMLHFPLQIAFMLLAANQAIPHRFYTEPLWLVIFIIVLALTSSVVFHKFEVPAQQAIRERLTSAHRAT